MEDGSQGSWEIKGTSHSHSGLSSQGRAKCHAAISRRKSLKARVAIKPSQKPEEKRGRERRPRGKYHSAVTHLLTENPLWIEGARLVDGFRRRVL